MVELETIIEVGEVKVEEVEEIPPREEESDDPMGLGLGSLTVSKSNNPSLANTQVSTAPFIYLCHFIKALCPRTIIVLGHG